MLFNSIEFLLFLPVVFLMYWYVLGKNLKLQNFFILVASYVFYGWWSWRFLLLIFFTSCCSFYSGILLQRVGRDRNRKWISGINIVLNLGILVVYKYYDFFVVNLVVAFRSIGVSLSLYSLNIVLPVGISFYTFQALSYTIDVYKRKLEPTRDIVSFLSFISFFPQLVAGPIERATNLLPQFLRRRVFNYEDAVSGCRQVLWGFFKKVVIADNCASVVNVIFDSSSSDQSGSTLLLGAIFFTFQIYGDFSGYSDIAIGTGKLFGIRLMRNFNIPYFSRDIAEFWRRWHISLNTWFRDYVYIPLGGSHGRKSRVIRNTFVIFLVSGLWHGANWTFLAWGGYHSLLFVPLVLLGKNRKNVDNIGRKSLLPGFRECFQILCTFVLVMFGWIIFRAQDIGHAFEYMKGIFTRTLFSYPSHLGPDELMTTFMILLLLGFEWINRDKEFGLDFHGLHLPRFIRYTVYAGLSCCIYFFGGSQETFIYFQF